MSDESIMVCSMVVDDSFVVVGTGLLMVCGG